MNQLCCSQNQNSRTNSAQISPSSRLYTVDLVTNGEIQAWTNVRNVSEKKDGVAGAKFAIVRQPRPLSEFLCPDLQDRSDAGFLHSGYRSCVAYMPLLLLSLLVCSGSAIPGEYHPSCPQRWPQSHCPLQRQQQQFCPGEGSASDRPVGCLCVHKQWGTEPWAAGDPDPWQTCLQGKEVRGFLLGRAGRRVWHQSCPCLLGSPLPCAPNPSRDWKTSATSRPGSPHGTIESQPFSTAWSKFVGVPLSTVVLVQLYSCRIKYLRGNFLTKWLPVII